MPQKSKKSFQGQMTGFRNRLKQFRETLRMTQEGLANELNLGINTMSRIERGDADFISLESLEALAKKVIESRMSLEWLFAGQGIPDHPKSLEAYSYPELLEEISIRYKKLIEDSFEQAKAKKQSERLPEKDAIIQIQGFQTVPSEDVPSNAKWHLFYVPIVGKVAAGAGIDTLEASQHPPGWCGEYLKWQNQGGNLIAVRVAGVSMEPNFRDGDIIVADTDKPADHGICCVLISVNGEREALLKDLKIKGDSIVLHSINSEIEDRIIARSQFSAAYKVLARFQRGRSK